MKFESIFLIILIIILAWLILLIIVFDFNVMSLVEYLIITCLIAIAYFLFRIMRILRKFSLYDNFDDKDKDE